MHYIEADGIALSFNNRVILSDIYVKCSTGEILGILGRNGCGKSSLLKIIFGSLKAQNQSVRIDGRYIPCLFMERDAVKYLPQSHLLPLNIRVKEAITLFIQNQTQQDIVRHLPEIESLLHHKVRQIPGGARRFLEAVLLLYSESKFILMDEPFSHLSPVLAEKLAERIVAQSQHKGIIITDHVYHYVMAISTRLILLSNQKTYPISNETQLQDMGYLPG